MYLASQPDTVAGFGSGLGGWLGQPGSVRVDVPVRHVECSATGLADLKDWTGFNWTCAEIRKMLNEDAGAAAAMAKTAAGFIGEPTAAQDAAFSAVFGMSAKDRPRGSTWTAGRIVKARFDGVFKLLASGGLLYSHGLPKRAGGPEPGNRLEYLFKAKAGELWIALGSGHFKEPFPDERASNVLAATLLAAYGEWVKRSSTARPLNNVFCYVKFVYQAWGDFAAPTWVLDHCPAST